MSVYSATRMYGEHSEPDDAALRRSGVRHQNWRDRAACESADPDLFFPETGDQARNAIAEAKRICAGCPVTIQCLRFALSSPEHHGVWGGLAERERRGMRPWHLNQPQEAVALCTSSSQSRLSRRSSASYASRDGVTPPTTGRPPT